jgi:hypothetical protein
MTQEKLRELKLATDDAIRFVKSGEGNHPVAVNWANLRCVQAAWVVTDAGDSYAQVTIEEASPEAYRFQNEVAFELTKHGWPDVHVVTEW